MDNKRAKRKKLAEKWIRTNKNLNKIYNRYTKETSIPKRLRQKIKKAEEKARNDYFESMSY